MSVSSSSGKSVVKASFSGLNESASILTRHNNQVARKFEVSLFWSDQISTNKTPAKNLGSQFWVTASIFHLLCLHQRPPQSINKHVFHLLIPACAIFSTSLYRDSKSPNEDGRLSSRFFGICRLRANRGGAHCCSKSGFVVRVIARDWTPQSDHHLRSCRDRMCLEKARCVHRFRCSCLSASGYYWKV